jgi:hypothetical protein
MGFACAQAKADEFIQISLSRQEADLLVHVLENLISNRAPRPDSFVETDPAYPVGAIGLADLEQIKFIVCSIKTLLLQAQSVIGKVTDDGSCFASIVTVLDIDDAQLNVIEWLKTLMREFRGVCP